MKSPQERKTVMRAMNRVANEIDGEEADGTA